MQGPIVSERRRARCSACLLAIGVAGLILAGFGPSTSRSAARAHAQSPAPVFTNPTTITNPYLPFATLNQQILEGKEDGKTVRVERTRMPGTKSFTIDGKTVAALIMEDREFVKGKLVEVALDYFAQSDEGTVYYLGEDVDDYRNGKIVGHDGAWLYGVHTQTLGVIMPANPKIGDIFRPEDVPGITRERDEVLSLTETVVVPAGTYTGVLKIREKNSEGQTEYKYYAPGVGVIKEVTEDGTLTLRSSR